MHRPIGRYRRSKQEITDILKHDTPFTVCLFPVAQVALFVQKWLKLGLRLVGLCLKDVIDFLCSEGRYKTIKCDALIRNTRF